MTSIWRAAPLALGVAYPSLALVGAASAQSATETVSWTVSSPAPDAVKPGARLALTLHGALQDGWHVYGLKQAPTGPTPLRVTLDPNAVAETAGAPTGSPPRTVHDAGFNLDTPLYGAAFTVTAPVRIRPHAAPGRQLIPLSVRFQTCNGTVCQPPKTVRLSAPITIRADG